MFLICSEAGKTPDELEGLTDGQIDWMAHGYIAKAKAMADSIPGSGKGKVYESVQPEEE